MNPHYTVDGYPATQVLCVADNPIGFDVPGYGRVWLTVAQNGIMTYDGPMDLPIANYLLRCPEDIGFFQADAYTITEMDERGEYLGQATLEILDPEYENGPSLFPAMDSASMLGLVGVGIAALYLLTRKRGVA